MGRWFCLSRFLENFAQLFGENRHTHYWRILITLLLLSEVQMASGNELVHRRIDRRFENSGKLSIDAFIFSGKAINFYPLQAINRIIVYRFLCPIEWDGRFCILNFFSSNIMRFVPWLHYARKCLFWLIALNLRYNAIPTHMDLLKFGLLIFLLYSLWRFGGPIWK